MPWKIRDTDIIIEDDDLEEDQDVHHGPNDQDNIQPNEPEGGDDIEFIPEEEKAQRKCLPMNPKVKMNRKETAPQGRIKGVHRALRNLEGFFNPDPYEFLEENANDTDEAESANLLKGRIKDHAMIANIHDGNPEPKSFYEARQSKEWGEWWKAMKTEFQNMEEKKVWDIRKRSELPVGRKLIGNRWVYALKDDGRFRARMVAKGFSQVPGKDFQENFAPVINDSTFHLVLAMKALLGLEAGQFDIETAFLMES